MGHLGNAPLLVPPCQRSLGRLLVQSEVRHVLSRVWVQQGQEGEIKDPGGPSTAKKDGTPKSSPSPTLGWPSHLQGGTGLGDPCPPPIGGGSEREARAGDHPGKGRYPPMQAWPPPHPTALVPCPRGTRPPSPWSAVLPGVGPAPSPAWFFPYPCLTGLSPTGKVKLLFPKKGGFPGGCRRQRERNVEGFPGMH